MSSSSNSTKTHFVTLPNGKRLNDAIVIENGIENLSNGLFHPDEIFMACQEVNIQNSSKEIKFSKDGEDPLMVMGDHPALHYRGNALKRHKIWLQTDYAQGMRKYGYTGWQHAIATATRSIKSVPKIEELMSWLNNGAFDSILKQHSMPPSMAKFNHAIFTRYEDENDFIGVHSDKERDIEENSYFCVVKLGATREFVLTDNIKNEIFWSKKLPYGSMVIVRAKSSDDLAANRLMKHGVPKSNEKCGPSGSIVFRCIKTLIPWDDVLTNIDKAKKDRQKRQARKRKRDNKSHKQVHNSRKQTREN